MLVSLDQIVKKRCALETDSAAPTCTTPSRHSKRELSTADRSYRRSRESNAIEDTHASAVQGSFKTSFKLAH